MNARATALRRCPALKISLAERRGYLLDEVAEALRSQPIADDVPEDLPDDAPDLYETAAPEGLFRAYATDARREAFGQLLCAVVARGPLASRALLQARESLSLARHHAHNDASEAKILDELRHGPDEAAPQEPPCA